MTAIRLSGPADIVMPSRGSRPLGGRRALLFLLGRVGSIARRPHRPAMLGKAESHALSELVAARSTVSRTEPVPLHHLPRGRRVLDTASDQPVVPHANSRLAHS